MLIALIRGHYGEKETLGKLYVNGEFECYTCEDKMREVPGKPISEWKVYGKTAIPTGQYNVDVTWSPRFQKELILIQGVPGFSGIRIHSGNTHKDTEGCILPGKTLLPDNAGVGDSKAAHKALFDKVIHVLRKTGTVTLEVVNGEPWT